MTTGDYSCKSTCNSSIYCLIPRWTVSAVKTASNDVAEEEVALITITVFGTEHLINRSP